ncbi:MAG: TonB-dependent receptor, partial [Deltaproteobacteria bacterium]|nr:TonB-dependent receptor [Deltaproteobacteria bacterium]
MSTGYRVDDLDWNIAGDINGNNPNIISELTWNDLESFQLKVVGKTTFHQLFMLRGSLVYSWILNGENQDSDFLGDDRTLEFSRSNNNSDEGNIRDASFGTGWQFSFGRTDFVMAPVIGYSYHEQNLTMTDGNQTVANPPVTPDFGPFSGLDSTYETEWKGPFIGLDFTFRRDEKSKIKPDMETFLRLEYHLVDFYAEADWNLRTDFAHPKSFEHEADGHGFILNTGIKFLFNSNWLLNLNLDYQNWSTDPGTDRTFFSNGTIGETRLNEVNWT